MYIPNSLWTWAFVLVTVSQAAVVLALEAYVFAEFQSNLKPDPGQKYTYTRSIPTFLSLYIFGFLFQLILVYDALNLKNTIQIIGLCMFNLALLIYAALQMDQIKDAVLFLVAHANDHRTPNIDISIWVTTRPFLVAIPCVLALGTLLMSIVAWKLYDEFAWTIYKHISADLKMKRRYLTFQIYIALLKFDFFFFLAFTIQFIVIIITTTDIEFALTIAAIPVTIAILFLAAWVTRKENTAGMICTIVLFLAGMAYFLFKLVRMYEPSHQLIYVPVRRPLTTFAVITIILIILTIINACMCTSNFHRGLKPYITSRKVEDEDEKSNMTEMPNLSHGPVPSRMTID